MTKTLETKTTTQFTLGQRARDKVSGYEGTLTACYDYLNGCQRYAIAGSDKDGAPQEFAFDREQIEGLDEAPLEVTPAPTGGPRGSTTPPRR